MELLRAMSKRTRSGTSVESIRIVRTWTLSLAIQAPDMRTFGKPFYGQETLRDRVERDRYSVPCWTMEKEGKSPSLSDVSPVQRLQSHQDLISSNQYKELQRHVPFDPLSPFALEHVLDPLSLCQRTTFSGTILSDAFL